MLLQHLRSTQTASSTTEEAEKHHGLYGYNTHDIHHRGPLLHRSGDTREKLHSAAILGDTGPGLDTRLGPAVMHLVVKQVAALACILWRIRSAVCL